MKQEFEPGRWYKMISGNNIWYMKDKFENNGLDSFREHIGGSYYGYSGNFGREGTYKYELADMSEVKPLLPDGHPDKFTNTTYEIY